MTLKLCPLIEYYIRKFLWKNHAENMNQKPVPDPFLILVNNSKQLLHARKGSFFEKDCQKAFKKLTLFFLLNQSLLMNKVFKNKRGLELVTSWSSSYETSSEKLLY